MLGPPKARHVDRPVLASLEALVPPGTSTATWSGRSTSSFVRELVRDRYAGRGDRASTPWSTSSSSS